MAMLAERKSKQKWSHDPRNKAWSTNTDRFGYQMLTKMGWSAGKGLGANESGSTSHVKVSLKNNNLGIGAKASQDDNWLAHQEDFNDLLAHLNRANSSDAGNEESDSGAKSKDMETIARSSRKRVFYQRFIKSKNTSSYSSEDMACIMGQRSKSAPDTPVDLSENEDSDDSCASCPAVTETHSLGMTTITSKQSVQDYFAMKMAELKAKRNRENSSAAEDLNQDTNNVKNDEESMDSTNEDKKKIKKNSKKRKLSEEEEQTSNENGEDGSKEYRTLSLDDGNPKKKKKKSKKRKLNKDEELKDLEDGTSEDTSKEKNLKATKLTSDEKIQKKKKKEKKRRKEKEGESFYELRSLEENKIKLKENQDSCEKEKKRKKKDRKSNIDEEITENISKKSPSYSKKKKKSKINCVDNENEEEDDNKKEKEKSKKQKGKDKKKKEKRSEDVEVKVCKGETKKKKGKKAK